MWKVIGTAVFIAFPISFVSLNPQKHDVLLTPLWTYRPLLTPPWTHIPLLTPPWTHRPLILPPQSVYCVQFLIVKLVVAYRRERIGVLDKRNTEVKNMFNVIR